MICKKCGNEVADDALVCDSCGKSLVDQLFEKVDKETGSGPVEYKSAARRRAEKEAEAKKRDPLLTENDKCYTELTPSGNKRYVAPGKDGKSIGMAWFKFVVYVQLFASALLDLYNSFRLFSGQAYGTKEEAKFMYDSLKNLKTIDFTFAALLIVLAVFAFITRNMLIKYKKPAPWMYLGFLVATMLVTIGQVITYKIMYAENYTIQSTSIVNLCISGLLFVANIIYFYKRLHLFDN